MPKKTPAALVPVIKIDDSKCVNCHACISACPIKYCNDGSGEIMKIRYEMCIGCGCCLEACTHGARMPLDDLEQFLAGLKNKEKMVAIVAPSITANFPGLYLNFNGWLKSLGVSAIFDVSFGAELTIKSYLEHIKTNNPRAVIAQPCPAIVNYIELYQPELIEYLAPADSPMVHAMKMIKNFYPKYQDYKILVVSPCVAKKRELSATGLGDYNVTYLSFIQLMNERKVELKDYSEIDFDNPPAERAVLFSNPGGLLETAAREIPGIAAKARKIEGPKIIYDYLKALPAMIKRGMNPLLIDCLSCTMGCNGGTGTACKNLSPDEVEYHVKKRAEAMINKYRKRGRSDNSKDGNNLQRAIDRYWLPGLYSRTYVDHSVSFNLTIPREDQLKEVYRKMNKEQKSDYLNCGSCGYETCEKMAIAIFNSLNTPKNCFKFREKFIDEEAREIKNLARINQLTIDNSSLGMFILNNSGIVEYANRMMAEISGTTSEKLIGRNLLKHSSYEAIGVTEKLLDLIKNNKSFKTEVIKYKSESSGKLSYRIFSGIPLVNTVGITEKILLSVEDVTDFMKANEALEKMNDIMVNRELKMIELKKENKKLRGGGSPDQHVEVMKI